MTEYAELHAHSCFSLLDGASTPEALAEQANHLGLRALALTDHDNLYGAVRLALGGNQYGIPAIYGAEMTLENDHHLTLLVENETGWRNLCALVTAAQHNAPKGSAYLPLEALENHTSGLIALSGCREGEIPSALLHKEEEAARRAAAFYCDLFGAGNFWIELQNHLLPGDKRLIKQLVGVAEWLGVGYVATNNVHYARREGQRLQDVLVCIRQLETLENCSTLRPNSEYYLKSPAEMGRLFAAYPQAISNTLVIAERCQFKLRYGLQDLPQFPPLKGKTALGTLRHLCKKGMRECYADQPAAVLAQLEHELTVIEAAGLANYFLIVWDIVRFAREEGILCQGRGSAANSLVAYLLGISPIDPLAHDLVFERFLSQERQVAPDIDIDFQADRREEVIQYVYERYGHDHAAMACTFVTFRKRSAIRDVARVMGIPGEMIKEQQEAESDDYHWREVLELCTQLEGLPRHLGIHNGGMVVTGSPLDHYLPTEPAAMLDRTVVQWDKESLEDVGLIKIDILGLGMLAAIANALNLIQTTSGERPDFARLPFDDPAVYAMIAAADTVGVFQVESRAQTQMLPRFRPACFADIIIAISLIRPGPIQGDMVHPYLRRRLGEEEISYLHPVLQPALQETLGVILFQEQVLKVARDLAGFTAGQGEQLRRALGSKNAEVAVERFRADFVAGAVTKGITKEEAETVFIKLKAFGSYSFAKSHAAAFAVLVYQSAWLKLYHTAAFFAALLNNQPMGFWSPAVLVNEARRLGVAFLPVDIHHSGAKCTLENGAVCLGLTQVHGIGEAACEPLLSAREKGAFHDLADFCKRTRLPRRLVENLIMAGAMDSWKLERRQLIWHLGELDYKEDALPLSFAPIPADLPDLTAHERHSFEHEMLGITLEQHPMSFYRAWLEERGFRSSQDLIACKDGQHVQVAGLVVVHQAPPTAKGMRFITLEDEWGFINLVVQPHTYEKHKKALRDVPVLLVQGVMQRNGQASSVLVQKPLVAEYS